MHSNKLTIVSSAQLIRAAIPAVEYTTHIATTSHQLPYLLIGPLRDTCHICSSQAQLSLRSYPHQQLYMYKNSKRFKCQYLILQPQTGGSSDYII